jgi:hypothetical protein
MNPIASTKIAKLIAVYAATLSLAYYATAAQGNFDELYDYYFPKGSRDVRAVYRRYFDKLLFDSSPPASDSKRATEVYHALRGDNAFFHAFLHNPDWTIQGAPSEECVYEAVFLLLRLGDDRFSQLLAREDTQTRNKVGYAIDPQIHRDKHHFPKTRASYAYRYVPPSQRELEQRQRVVVATATTGFTQDETNRLYATLKKEKRFSRVQVISTDKASAPAVITAPESMPRQDRADLQRLIRDQLGDKEAITYSSVEREKRQ